MEENQKQEPEVKVERQCALPGCTNMFTPYDSSHIYCSNSHRGMANKKKKKNLGNVGTDASETAHDQGQQSSSFPFLEPKERKDIAVPKGLSVEAQFIIDNLREQRDDWKQEWREEREARKKLQTDKEQLEKQLADLKHEHEIKEIRDSKPTGLGAIMGPDVMKDYAQYIGPVAQELLMGVARMATSRMGGGMAGLNNPNANLPGTAGEIMSAIASWLPNQKEDTQRLFYAMMKPVIESSEEQAVAFFTHILRFIQNNNSRATGTEGFGYGG